MLATVWLIPIVSTLFISFKTEKQIAHGGVWSLPKVFHWETYLYVWKNVQPYFINSLIITIPAAVFSVLFASLGAYVLARKVFIGNKTILIFFLAGMMIPYSVVISPLFRLMKGVGLYNTFWAQILTNISFGIPGCIFVLRNFFVTIPVELEDAARIDGCSEFGVFVRIILPLARPAVAVMVAFQFIWIWNTLIWGLVLAINERAQPIMVGILSLKGTHAIAWNIQCAGALISVIPPLCVFLLIQRYLAEGLHMELGSKG